MSALDCKKCRMSAKEYKPWLYLPYEATCKKYRTSDRSSIDFDSAFILLKMTSKCKKCYPSIWRVLKRKIESIRQKLEDIYYRRNEE